MATNRITINELKNIILEIFEEVLEEKKKGGLKLDLKKGALHKTLGKPEDKKLTKVELEKAAKSKNEKTRKRAQFALNARKWNKK